MPAATTKKAKENSGKARFPTTQRSLLTAKWEGTLFVILIMRLEDAKPARANSRGFLNPWKD